MKRSFPLALDWGSGAGYIYRAICAEDSLFVEEETATNQNNNSNSDPQQKQQQQKPKGGIGGVQKLVQIDSSYHQLHRDAHLPVEGSHRCATYRLPIHVSNNNKEEEALPFPDGTFDLVTSACALHWVNRLPHALREMHRVLKPDGCLLLAVVGGSQTLPELRAALVLAELERDGGVSPHVGPFVQASDIGSLVQQAGFALPTIDVDSHVLSYPHALVLMEHLQRMGENNAALQRRRDRVSLDTFLATACIYDQLYPVMPSSSDNDDENATQEVEASVQIIYAIGWTPHESQPLPLQRGTAQHKVGDLTFATPSPTVEVTRSNNSSSSK